MSTTRARLQAMVDGTRPPGVYRWTSRAHPAAMRRELGVAGWGCHLLNGATVTDRERFFDACTDSLALPVWCGRNVDALADCLADLSWLPRRGHVLLWLHYGVFADHDPKGWDTVQDVLLGACAERSRLEVPPLYVLLRGHGPADGLATF